MHRVPLQRHSPTSLDRNLLSGLWDALDESAIVAFTGPDGRILEVNSCFCRVSGYTREELLGQDHRILNSGHHPPGFFRDLWATIRRGETWRGEIRNRAKGGRFYWVDTTILPVHDNSGEHVGYLSVRIDITERKQAEEQLHEQFDLLRNILDCSPVGIAVFNGESGQCILANPAIANILGTSLSDMMGHRFREIASWRRSGQLEMAEKTLATGVPTELDIHSVSGAGKEFWIHCKMTRLQRDQRPHLLAIALDVAETRRAEEALHQSGERLRLVMDAGRVGFWDWDLRTGDSYWSELVGEMLGEPDGIVSDALSLLVDHLHPEDRERQATMLRDHLEKDLPYSIELRIRQANGSYGTFVCRGQALKDKEGHPCRMLGTLLDITSLKHQEEAFIQAQKLESLGLLASGIAHDVNNLLAALQGHLDLVSTHLEPRGEVTEHLASAMDTVDRTSELTRSLLAYAGKAPLLMTRVDLNEVVKGMARMLGVSIPKAVQLELILHSGLPHIQADPSQLQQVILNLITNAVDAIGPREGKIVVRTRAAEPPELDGVVLQVLDTGNGIAPEHLTKIFDPFFTTKATGRGLGLSAMDGILRRHGGEISVESRVGVGTTFSVRFPSAP